MMSPHPNLQKCDGCSQYFYVCHGLIYINGSLFIASHNEVHDKILYLSKTCFPPSCIHDKTLIQQGYSRSGEESLQVRRGWIQDLISSSEAYDKYELTILLASHLEILTWIPTIMSQWVISWIVGRRLIKEILVSTAMIKVFFFHSFTLSV